MNQLSNRKATAQEALSGVTKFACGLQTQFQRVSPLSKARGSKISLRVSIPIEWCSTQPTSPERDSDENLKAQAQHGAAPPRPTDWCQQWQTLSGIRHAFCCGPAADRAVASAPVPSAIGHSGDSASRNRPRPQANFSATADAGLRQPSGKAAVQTLPGKRVPETRNGACLHPPGRPIRVPSQTVARATAHHDS